MKEPSISESLTLKEKAKRYDEALAIAKNIYFRNALFGVSECKDILCTLETIFPELKES